MGNAKILSCIGGVLLAAASFSVAAVTVIAPGDLEFVEGNRNNGFPFGFGAPQRYQQAYDASHFGGVSGIVEQISFRLDDSDPSFTETYDILLRLSHISATTGTLSSVFALNIGRDETVVLSNRAYRVSGTGGPGPNPFDIAFDVDNLFSYDGVSNLLLDITIFSSSSAPQFDFSGRGVAADGQRVVSRLGNPNSLTGTPSEGTLVTAFVIASQVPEPDTIAILVIGLLGFCFRRGAS